MFQHFAWRRVAALVCAIGLCLGSADGKAAPAKKPAAAAATKTQAKKKPNTKPATNKKPAAAKPKSTIEARLKKLGLKTNWHKFKVGDVVGENLYAEVGPLQKPSKRKNGKPQRLANYWSVFVAPLAEPDADGNFPEGVRNMLDLAEAAIDMPRKSGGVIFVFVKPESKAAIEEFAKLVAATQRTVSSVSCGGMPDRSQEIDCKGLFFKWGSPKIIGYPKQGQ